MASDAPKSVHKKVDDAKAEVETEFFAASVRELAPRPAASQMSLMLPPTENPSVRYAYNMVMKVLACAKLGEHALTVAVTPNDIYMLLDFAKEVFIGQTSCLEFDGPINICGDIHGQFADLLRVFDKIGFPCRTNYLFLGDYVDRGKHCIETVLLLFSYKVLYPNHFLLLRGNHECPLINKQYGFYEECQRRYKIPRVWEAFQDVFAWMPMTAIITEKILCMHGGLSPNLKSLDQLRAFKRPNYQPDTQSIETDILWSDPSTYTKTWAPNSRGVSFVFGVDALRRVLDDLKVDLVVRAHQVVQDGYEFFGARRLVTVFTAPFYCGQFDNAAAVLCVTNNLVCSFKILRPKRRLVRSRFTGENEADKLKRGELSIPAQQ